MENSIKVGGWGLDRSDFPLISFLKKYMSLKNYLKVIFGEGEPPQLGLWSDGKLELPSPLEEPSGNCQMTHIMQNLFHEA